MVHLTHLNALQALEAAVRTGSLKAAAEELGVTAAAVGQRIRTLEAYFGVTFLERGRHGLQPAPALREAMGDLADGFERLNRAAETLRMGRFNTLRIGADADWAELWLAPRLQRFREANPALDIVVDNIDGDPSLTGRADFTVRFGPPDRQGDLLFHDYPTPVGSPMNTRRVADMPIEKRLEGFPLLHLDTHAGAPETTGWPEWVARFGHRLTGADRGVRYRRSVPALQAAISHAGMLLCGLSLVLEALDAGTVVLLFDPREGAWTRHAYMLTCRPEVLRHPQARKFRDWLLAEAADTRTRLEALAGGAGARLAAPEATAPSRSRK